MDNTKNKLMLNAGDIVEILGVSEGMAYKIIRELNTEIRDKGFHTVRGRVSRKYFEESYYGAVTPEKG
ncbi:MAG: hypothetical protein PUD05_06860 [Lachnospiraceae bacterium]|nr:hypothetical protein [Lachnospiraceae bacterium]MDD5860911.1 hypothetical protein [Eubacteriales bacterium]